jgi:creatinine amidohydrolase
MKIADMHWMQVATYLSTDDRVVVPLGSVEQHGYLILAFPGTVSLRIATYMAVARDILDSLAQQGFRRIALVNGHGGNSPVGALAAEWMGDNPTVTVLLHNWWNAPMTWKAVQDIDPLASHASWMENFPWNRVGAVPEGTKQLADLDRLRRLAPAGVREAIGDGNYGGAYEKPDHLMLALWHTAVEETREIIQAL